jgi:hypothetical protein
VQATPHRAPSVSTLSSASSARRSASALECPTFGAHAVFAGKSLQNLSSILLPPNIKALNVERNLLTDFAGFVPSAHLEVLKASHNPITSLRGIPPLPKLASIEISDTPFARNQFGRVALVILFAKSLRLIDGDRITNTERQIAASYPPGTDSLLRAGWIATWPPPPPADLPKITAALAEKLVANRTATQTRAVPVIARRAKPQSKLLDEALRKQAEELAKLEENIRKVQARNAKGRRK